MKDAIAYMAWERVVPWKILSMMARPGGSLAPVGFGTRYGAFYNLLEPGSRIWVVTRISREFSLAGCVTVKEMLDRNDLPRASWPEDIAGLFEQWRFVARSDPDRSAFFEANDAEPVLAKHSVRFAQNRTIVYRESSLEELFQACMAQARRTVFLSYRWEEARRFAIALARAFRRRGMSPWLDALSIPAYEASREPGVTAPRLKKLIRLGIEQSRLAVVINTKSYASSDWTRMELDHIRRKKVPWIQVMRGGVERRCDEPPILNRKPEEIVEEILRRRARGV